MTSNSSTPSRAPWHLWFVGGLMALWNGFGVFDFVATNINWQPYLSNFPQEMLEYLATLSTLDITIWGLAVILAFAGSVFLLLQSRLAFISFVVSFLAATTSVGYGYQKLPDELKDPVMSASIIAIAAALVGYSWWLRRCNVLR